MGFAPACNLARLGESTTNAEINARIVNPFFFDQLAKFPLGAKLLTCGQRHMGTGAQGFEGIWILRAQRVFNKERACRFYFAAKPKHIGQIQAGMHVKSNLNIVAHSLARQGVISQQSAEIAA